MTKDLIATIDALSLGEKRDLLIYLQQKLHPFSGYRSKSATRLVIQLFAQKPSWTVKEMKERIRKYNQSVSHKEIYNSLGFLTRTGAIKHICYGSYST